MLAENIIKTAQTLWAAPFVFVLKKDRMFHFCGSYRKLDAVTKRNSYPIFCVGEGVGLLGGATIFWVLYANSGY